MIQIKITIQKLEPWKTYEFNVEDTENMNTAIGAAIQRIQDMYENAPFSIIKIEAKQINQTLHSIT